ncbi:MAG: RIP metalloprotease RseP [Bacteroidales bacterium]|nr:RIP metalloprotease RseP [Bacteroidales bacterium]
MEVFVKIAQLLLSLSILVILHEAGHFMFAKLFKTRVEKFYLFFDPWFSLLKFKKGETQYGIGWIPLGGYVKISGMIDESMDKEQMKKPAEPWEFRSKPSWQRLIIMLGGVMVNFLLAIVIYIMVLFVWGEEYLPTENVKYGILVDSVGVEMGLRNGDKIISVDNQEVENFSQIIPDILLNERKTIQVKRDGRLMEVRIPEKSIPLLIKGKGRIDVRTPFSPLIVAGFIKESPAKNAGLQTGDEILGLNNEIYKYYDQFKKKLDENIGEEVSLQIKRNSNNLEIPVVVNSQGMIGIRRDIKDIIEFRRIEYGFFESIPAGIAKGVKTLQDYLKQIKLIFSKDTKAYESLGGFITIGSIFPGVWDWYSFWNLTAFLSIILAIMNVLPIPALDGGHVMFLLYEVITGRKPGDKFMEYAQMTGMIIILALLLFANGNDIIRWLNK